MAEEDKGGAGAIVDEGEEAKKPRMRKGEVAMPSHIRRGYFFIKQRSKVFALTKKFQRYWFCIDEECCQIRYYTRAMKLRGTIDLRLASDVQIQPHEDRYYPFVINSERTGRSTVLASLTQEECLTNANYIRQIICQMPPINEALYKQFVEADADGSFTLEFPEVKALFAQRKIQITIATMRQKFDEVDLDGDESLDFSEFERLDELFRQDTYASELFHRYCTCSRFMDAHVFRRFLRSHQHEGRIQKEDIYKIMAAHKSGEAGAPRKTMDVWGFTDWLTSVKENGAVSVRRSTEVTDSKKRPLSSYFINGSRQTYLLTANPLGPVGVAGYTAALRRGARFVEIDTKADMNGVPVVAHPQGQHKVPLEDVAAEIARLAFAPELGNAGTMPLIVSINAYLAPDEQNAAAEILERAFGPRLATIPRKAAALPSLESLMGKIVLMMKLTTAEEMARSTSVSSSEDRSSVLPFFNKKKRARKPDSPRLSPPMEQPSSSSTTTTTTTTTTPTTPTTQHKASPSTLGAFVTRVESDEDSYSDSSSSGSSSSGSSSEDGDDESGEEDKKTKTKSKKKKHGGSKDDAKKEKSKGKGKGEDEKKKGSEDDVAALLGLGSDGSMSMTQLLSGLGAQATQATEQVATPVAHEEVSGESSEDDHVATRTRRVEFAVRSITCERLAKLIHLRIRRFAGVQRPSHMAAFVKDSEGYLASTPTTLSSARLARICSKNAEGALRSFTRNHIVKVYPTTDRPSDMPAWAAGVQICPVNVHATTAMSLAEEAFFQDNGRCGFLEKPAWMLREPMTPPPENAVKLRVKIVSARQLPRIDNEVVDPFVAMFVKGWKDDQHHHTTKVIINNGWDPRWDETVEVVLHAPELDVLLFTIWDKDNTSQNDFIGNAVVAVRSLKLGVRSLPLYDENRVALLGSRLLIEVSMEPLVAHHAPAKSVEARALRHKGRGGRDDDDD